MSKNQKPSSLPTKVSSCTRAESSSSSGLPPILQVPEAGNVPEAKSNSVKAWRLHWKEKFLRKPDFRLRQNVSFTR